MLGDGAITRLHSEMGDILAHTPNPRPLVGLRKTNQQGSLC